MHALNTLRPGSRTLRFSQERCWNDFATTNPCFGNDFEQVRGCLAICEIHVRELVSLPHHLAGVSTGPGVAQLVLSPLPGSRKPGRLGLNRSTPLPPYSIRWLGCVKSSLRGLRVPTAEVGLFPWIGRQNEIVS